MLPCYFADRYDNVIRASDTIAALDMTLWVLTHPDLKETARVRALMTHLYDTLGQNADLYAGETRTRTSTIFSRAHRLHHLNALPAFFSKLKQVRG